MSAHGHDELAKAEGGDKQGERAAEASLDRNVNFHSLIWQSGKQGGGKVPADLEWKSNPKQHQEEYGSPVLPKRKE